MLIFTGLVTYTHILYTDTYGQGHTQTDTGTYRHTHTCTHTHRHTHTCMHTHIDTQTYTQINAHLFRNGTSDKSLLVNPFGLLLKLSSFTCHHWVCPLQELLWKISDPYLLIFVCEVSTLQLTRFIHLHIYHITL